MEDEKSQGLDLVNWKPRRADGINSILNTVRLETQES